MKALEYAGRIVCQLTLGVKHFSDKKVANYRLVLPFYSDRIRPPEKHALLGRRIYTSFFSWFVEVLVAVFVHIRLPARRATAAQTSSDN